MSRDTSPSTAKSRTMARNCSCVPESRLQTASSHVQTQTAIACKTFPSSEHKQTPAAKRTDSPRSVSIGMAPAGQFEERTSREEFFHSFSQASTQSRFVAAVGPSCGHGTVIRMRRLEKKHNLHTQTGLAATGRARSKRRAQATVSWTHWCLATACFTSAKARDAGSNSLVFTNRADLQR